MKKLFVFSLFLLFAFQSYSQLRVRNDEFVQIGYNSYRTLSFGNNFNTPNNGEYAIEYWNQGLNFWKPWPAPNAANYVLFLRNDNNIGVGHQGSAQFRLDVAGTIRAAGYSSLSDKRLKRNIEPMKGSLGKILKLSGFSYQYDMGSLQSKAKVSKDLEVTDTKAKTMENGKQKKESLSGKTYGFIAQEVQEIIPEAIKKDDNGYLSMDYIQIIPHLVEAMKQQQRQIDRLKKELKSMKGK